MGEKPTKLYEFMHHFGIYANYQTTQVVYIFCHGCVLHGWFNKRVLSVVVKQHKLWTVIYSLIDIMFAVLNRKGRKHVGAINAFCSFGPFWQKQLWVWCVLCI